jgi:hypothetical protein
MRPSGLWLGRHLAAAVRLTALGWLLLAGGCGPGLAVYDKPGVTYEDWRRDDTECRRAAPTTGGSEPQKGDAKRALHEGPRVPRGRPLIGGRPESPFKLAVGAGQHEHPVPAAVASSRGPGIAT